MDEELGQEGHGNDSLKSCNSAAGGYRIHFTALAWSDLKI